MKTCLPVFKKSYDLLLAIYQSVSIFGKEFKYTIGEKLKNEALESGQYSTMVADIPTCNKTITFNFVLCKDDNGNTYAVVQIGTGKSGVQTWMAENLNVGTRIENQNSANDGIIEKYCYEDSVYYCNIYGGLYQWNEMMKYDVTQGVQGICPGGWHIPTDAEFTDLSTFLGSDNIAGGKMKSTGNILVGPGIPTITYKGEDYSQGDSLCLGRNEENKVNFLISG